MSEKIVLIDGHSILNRAFFGIRELTNSEGLHTNAIYGFLNIMLKILDEEQPDYLMVAFDRSEPTFRHKMFDAYKGTRKPMADELREQVPVIKEVLTAMDVPIAELPGYEADDILGTLARQAEAQGLTVRIISGDRDLLQLATASTMVRIPKTKQTGTEIEDYLEEDVIKQYQVTPREFIDVKALMGDSSDNIPGVPGIGEKTATNLIVQYHSIENAYAHADDITAKRARENLKEFYDMAVMSKELATICTAAPVTFSPEKARLGNLFTPEAYPILKRLELKSFLGRFDAQPAETDTESGFSVVGSAADWKAKRAELDPRRLTAVFYKNPDWSEHCDADGQQVLPFAETDHTPERLWCVSLADGAGHIICVNTGEITSQELIRDVQALADECECFISPDLKHALEYLDIAGPGKCVDTSIAAYLLDPMKSSYSYDDIASKYLGEMLRSPADFFGKAKPEKAREKQPEDYAKMCCLEAYTAAKAADLLLKDLEETEMLRLYREIEMPLVFTLSEMEKAGVRVDAKALKEYGEQLTDRIDALEHQIYDEAGEEFNINSPKQLGVILFEKLQLPNGKKTKTGFSTAADVLEKLAPEHPIIADILEYRTLTKLKSTYADGLAAYIGPDGRIHSNFNQTITATGRISSTEPNLQNIPIRMELGRLIRKVFIPADGCVLIDADYSQIELRVLAHMSGDQNLISAYQQDKDIHRITASQVFHTPFDEVTPLQRRNAKAVNFGIVYGISSFGLSQDLSITRKEASEYIERYFETYPGIKVFLDQSVLDAKEKGYAITLYGRRRPVDELKSSNFMTRQFGERVAMNSPIQGTAADIIKIAMNRVRERLKAEGLKSRLILQVHDELLIEADASETEAVKKILEEEMRGAADLSVPLEVDMNEGMNWYEAH